MKIKTKIQNELQFNQIQDLVFELEGRWKNGLTRRVRVKVRPKYLFIDFSPVPIISSSNSKSLYDEKDAKRMSATKLIEFLKKQKGE